MKLYRKMLSFALALSVMLSGLALPTAVNAADKQTEETITVQIAGYAGIIRDTLAVRDKTIDAGSELTPEITDGYTVKNAICDALDANTSAVVNDMTFSYWYMSKIAYTEKDGKVIPDDYTKPKALEGNWNCLVNGKAAKLGDKLSYGDSVVYYFQAKKHAAVTYADFTEKEVKAVAGKPCTVTLKDVDGKPVSDAVLSSANGVMLAKTNKNGKAKLTFQDAGLEIVTAVKTNEKGDNLLTGNRLLVHVEKAESTGTVAVRIVGDSAHKKGLADHKAYEQWVPTTYYKFKSGKKLTAKDVLFKAAEEFGVKINEEESAYGGYYITSVTAPKKFGGHTLASMGNGSKLSGWMFDVNGESPYVSYDAYELADGDVVTLYFVDDYYQENYDTSNGLYMSHKAALKPIEKPEQAVLKKLVSKKKGKAVLTWSRQKDADGYEICYADNKDFKNAETKVVKNAAAKTFTLSKLASKQTIYVKLRAYKIVGKKTLYGKYSKKAKVIVK